MTGEVGNLVLELLRLFRAEMASFKSGVNQSLDAVTTELGSLEHAVSGIAYILVEMRGELLGHAERIERLEQART